MRRLVKIVFALAILAGSSLVYPTSLQAGQDMCGEFSYLIIYWDSPDANGNCPPPGVHYEIVGEYGVDCQGNITEWGFQGGCDYEYDLGSYCGDCIQQ